MPGGHEDGTGSAPGQIDHRALSERDFPELFLSADSDSLREQRKFILVTRAELISLVVGAGLSAVSVTQHARVFQAAAAIFFLAAFVSELIRLITRPDQLWYENRAAAESAKTLAWRYAVGGEPFMVGARSARETDVLFITRLRDVWQPLKNLPMVPSGDQREQITRRMRESRDRPLADRMETYRTGRVVDQSHWYTRKAEWNRGRARVWLSFTVVLEGLAIGTALLRALGLINQYDLPTAIASVVGAMGAWLQTKQHSTLASSYAVAARELQDIEALFEGFSSEEEWAAFVARSEDAISREHILWRASRGP